MKLQTVHEAKYAGRYDLLTVRARYMQGQQNPVQPVYFHSATINREENHVLARLYVVAGGVNENDVRNQVKDWHDKNEIPFGEIVGITELDDDWSVYVKYKGPKQSRRVTEAKYVGKYSNKDVLRQYHRTENIQANGQTLLQNAKIITDNKISVVQARFVSFTDDQAEAEQSVKQYHNEYNIPFGEIQYSFEIEDDNTRDEWFTYVHYHGHSGTQ